MHIKPFQAIFPDFQYISSTEDFFARVKEDYPEFKHCGYFQKAEQEAFYIYQVTRKGRTHTGLISLANVQDYLKGQIKIHEHTIRSKEEQQIKLLKARAAQVKPILLAYEDVEQLNQLLAKWKKSENLFYQTTLEEAEEIHSFWAIKEASTIQEITDLVNTQIEEAYIADGHHRSSTMASLFQQYQDSNSNPYSHFLVALFSKSQLEVHDFNRVVEGLVDSTISSFIARISKVCNIRPLEEGRKPTKKHQMTLFINKEWYRLSWRSSVLKKHKNDAVLLDAKLLDKYIFEDILDIEDIKADSRIKYVGGPSGIEGLQNKTLKNENRIGFCLFPVELDDLMIVADRKEVMPPKSTWFEPRIKNGLLVLELDANKLKE